MKGKGLGWRLMRHLITYAEREKLEEIYGEVLAGNTTMLQMCAEMGFEVEAEQGDVGLRHVRLRLVKNAQSAGRP